jgi:hypothetical protein
MCRLTQFCGNATDSGNDSESGIGYPHVVIPQAQVNASRICEPPQAGCPAAVIDNFDLSTLPSSQVSANGRDLPALTCARSLAPLLPWGEMRRFGSDLEAVMWKITTRGFTLQEVLLLAAMNLLASPATVPNHQKRTSQKSQGDQACEGSTR